MGCEYRTLFYGRRRFDRLGLAPAASNFNDSSLELNSCSLASYGVFGIFLEYSCAGTLEHRTSLETSFHFGFKFNLGYCQPHRQRRPTLCAPIVLRWSKLLSSALTKKVQISPTHLRTNTRPIARHCLLLAAWTSYKQTKIE